MQIVSSFFHFNLKQEKQENKKAKITGFSMLELLTIKSWIDNGFCFKLYVYEQNPIFDFLQNELKDCCDTGGEKKKGGGLCIVDANEVVPFSEFFLDNRGIGLAGFSDYFRYVLANNTLETWVDMDMVCLKEHKLDELILISQLACPTTSMLRLPNEHFFGNILVENARKIYKKELESKDRVTWGCIGPKLLSQMIKEYNLDKQVKPYTYACPVNWDSTREFIEPYKLKLKMFDSPALHMWNEMWRMYEIDKNKRYKHSLYDELRDKYEIFTLWERLEASITGWKKLKASIKNKIFY